MKKNYLKSFSTFLLISLFFIGCQKESIQISKQTNEVVSASNAGSLGGCRLTSYDYYDGISDIHMIENFSYKNGLVDEWIPFYGSIFKMEYDSKGKLKTSRMYEGETLVFTIEFFYEKGKAVKEIWYDGNTQNIIDEVTNTYNLKGELIRSVSIGFDYEVFNTYTNRGELESWFFFSGGLPIIKGEYIYKSNFKNPYQALPGIDYSFVYSNSAFLTGNKWPSGEKIMFYDENGDPFTVYEQDPSKTVWQAGEQHYPLQANYIDMWSLLPFSTTFTYENCVPGSNNSHASKKYNHQFSKTSQKPNYRYILQRTKGKSMKMKAMEFRQQFLKKEI